MRELGISIYPDVMEKEDYEKYIEKSSKLGFSRIFTNFLSVDNPSKLKDFISMISFANTNKMKVIADVSPVVFKDLNIDFRNLNYFKEIGLHGIRLDEGFSGNEESIMSFNDKDLKIEFNMSSTNKYLENILSYQPNTRNLLGCHNFYPHRYTGISKERLLKNSKIFKENNIKTAAFVFSPTATIGPWPVDEGLPTLEDHREKPLISQVKDLWNTGVIDDIIISNCFPKDEELQELANLNRDILEIGIELEVELPNTEKSILFDTLHFNRGDVSEYMIRSTMPRVYFKDYDFKLLNPRNIEVGDILIDSNLYGRYAGEVQIALKPMKNYKKTSVVGKVNKDELNLIHDIKPWQKFKLKENNI